MMGKRKALVPPKMRSAAASRSVCARRILLLLGREGVARRSVWPTCGLLHSYDVCLRPLLDTTWKESREPKRGNDDGGLPLCCD